MKKFFLAIIVIALLTTSYFVNGRVNVEKEYKGYEVLADYEDFEKISFEENRGPSEFFSSLNGSVDSVAILENTIASMKKNPNYNISTSIEGSDLIVKGDEKDLKFIEENLNETLKDKRAMEYLDGSTLKIEGKPMDIITYKLEGVDNNFEKVGETYEKASNLEYVGLGFDENKIEQVQNSGLKVNLRPSFIGKYQDGTLALNRHLNAIDTYAPDQRFVIWASKEFYPEDILDRVEKEFENRSIGIGLVESANQRGNLETRGINRLIFSDKIKKLRVFTTWDYIQRQYNYKVAGHDHGEEIANVYYRAVSERNISVVYLKPFIDKTSRAITDPEAYSYVLDNVENRLGKIGVVKSDVSGMENWTPKSIYKLPIAIGIVAAGVLLLDTIFRIPNLLAGVLFILGSLLGVVFFGLGKTESFGSTLFNLAGIVVFPSLALCYVLSKYNAYKSDGIVHRFRNSYFTGVIILVISVLICLIGAMFEVSLLSGTKNFLEITIFRGVKISQLLPIFISFFIFLAFVGFGRKTISDKPKFSIGELYELSNSSVKIWQVGAVLILLGMVGILILRGGNSNISISSLELGFRNMLENVFPVRPRTKAIFIGYPALVLLIYIGMRKRGNIWALPLTLFISIGQSNILNTFSHIRTPFFISLTRVGGEIIVSIITSFILVVFVEICIKGYDKYIGSK